MAAPQRPCPLPGGAGLAGIESRDDDSPPHGHAAWRGARSGRKGVRGAEPSCGFAARRLKRAGRGYMLPSARVPHGLSLRQRTLPPMPEERNTSRTEPSTRFYNRTFMFLNLTEQKIQDKNSDSHMR